MEEKYVTQNDLKLSYLDFGNGSKTVVCLHGHGKNAEDFLFLKDKGVRVISINLFLHGNSSFNPSRIKSNLVQKKDVEKLLEKLLKQEKINNFHVVAYSQGGRFLLTVLPSFFNRVKSVHLLAIDGLNNHNFYSWTQRRWWARKLFKRWTKKPNELLGIASFLAKRKIIHTKIVDFLNYYAKDSKKLELAYKTWASFRKLRPNTTELTNCFSDRSKRFKLIMGQHDQIITVKSAKKFLDKINRPDALVVINCGHDFFREEAIKLVKKEISFEV